MSVEMAETNAEVSVAVSGLVEQGPKKSKSESMPSSSPKGIVWCLSFLVLLLAAAVVALSISVAVLSGGNGSDQVSRALRRQRVGSCLS